VKQFILGVLLICTFAFGTHRILAQCDCFGASKNIRGTPYSTAYEELQNADVVFYGQVVEMRMIESKSSHTGEKNYEVEIKLRVEKAWRKDLEEFVQIREYSNSCGIGFEIADRWLVYATFDQDKHLRTNYCSRSRSADKEVESDFKEFEKRGERQTKIIRSAP